MPPGAKKRKALKKKQQQQQESTVTSTNTKGSTNEKGHDENGRQDDSSLSSPASQGNGEFGEAKDPSGLAKDTAKEISDHVTQGLGPNNGIAIAVERGKDGKKNTVDLASQDSCGYSIKEITPVAEPVVLKRLSMLRPQHTQIWSTRSLMKRKSIHLRRKIMVRWLLFLGLLLEQAEK
ncbi:hypothetical protein Bca4012_076826 [Brassica carinata]|uniref:Uncharacterized protein n=1 Tax=Brassica carinata TaxID=52824 RepID=A0A8X7QA21_BRACI|nr:hypothetical protein Bca52824_072907 [Brassica carinata]